MLYVSVICFPKPITTRAVEKALYLRAAGALRLGGSVAIHKYDARDGARC